MEANGAHHLGIRSGESSGASGLAKVEKVLSKKEEAKVVELWIKEKMMAIEDMAQEVKSLLGKLEKVLQLQKERGEHARTKEERWKAQEANSRGLLSWYKKWAPRPSNFLLDFEGFAKQFKVNGVPPEREEPTFLDMEATLMRILLDHFEICFHKFYIIHLCMC